MKTVEVPVAYVPLVDAAPLIIAQEMGFAEAEGLALDLVPASSWSSLRDMLAFGRVDAAHMLSAMPVAMALGLGGVRQDISAVSVLSVNGDVIGVSRALEDKMRAKGYFFDFQDPVRAAEVLADVVDGKITFGVPFPFSMHQELLDYWISNSALADIDYEVRTVPPPLMARALADGDVDAFCVGEPWGSLAVDSRAGALLIPGNAIWAFSPEKVLGVRTDWAETEPHLLGRLMRAVWKAGRWLKDDDRRGSASEILSRARYLNVPAEMIDRALSGRFTVSGHGEQRDCPHFVVFHNGAANFPWRSQAKWIGARLAVRNGLDVRQAMETAGSVFRSDIYRQQLTGTGAEMPGASEKLEGSILTPTAVASNAGHLSLMKDAFFDGRVFDPLKV
ncbi:CmpA/NrtA family ABC transporter substrate-binding protein [Sagittula sp. S175]|uniref:CmpA/NrtA family ABC transporter substrate-binding protein n=1 Tax=Sagittula sp. S175 TaxID=3415129 RepID=UPI003C79E90D